jgi:hypothetical protein
MHELATVCTDCLIGMIIRKNHKNIRPALLRNGAGAEEQKKNKKKRDRNKSHELNVG